MNIVMHEDKFFDAQVLTLITLYVQTCTFTCTGRYANTKHTQTLSPLSLSLFLYYLFLSQTATL